MHPDGALYCAYRTKVSPSSHTRSSIWRQPRFEPIYTDTNMCDPVLGQAIEQSIEEINKLRLISPPIPEDWELALELREDRETGGSICSYYFVCHSTRCLFWLHELDPKDALVELYGVTEDTHIRESALVSGAHRTKNVIRLGTANPVLVRSRHIVAMTSYLTIPGLIEGSSWWHAPGTYWDLAPYEYRCVRSRVRRPCDSRVTQTV